MKRLSGETDRSRGWHPVQWKNLFKMTGLFILVVTLAWWAGLQPIAARTAPVSVFDAAKHFTIQKIEPDASREEVKISFSHPVPLAVLQAYLRILPQVKVDWHRTRMSPEGILTLKGDFKYGAGHLVTLKDGVTVEGRTYFPTVRTFRMPDRPATVEFVGAKRVIERDSRQLLHVRVSNVDNLNLEKTRVPPLLLPQALAAEKAGVDQKQALTTLRAAAQQLIPLLQGKSVYTPFGGTLQEEKQLFPAGGEKNRVLAVSLPLSFRQHKEAGALELIRVKDNQEGSQAFAGPSLFRITDLGLTYKIGGKSLLLWVTSLKNGVPVADTQVLAFTRQTEVFPIGVTDKDGILTFSSRELEGLSLKQLGSFKPTKRLVEINDITHLMAGKTGDVSYIEIKPHGNLKPEEVWQEDSPKQSQHGKGVVFTERGVYRPGEKVFFKGTVREYRDGAILPPEAKSCVFSVDNPRGEQVFIKKVDLSDFGTAAGEIPTQPHWALGTYTMTMFFGSQDETQAKAGKSDSDETESGEAEEKAASNKPPQPQTTTTFQVQEFKPPRHFTDITFARVSRPDRTYVNRERQAEFVKIGIIGAYYAGGPVKHGQVRWRIHQAPTNYQIQNFDRYSFGYGENEKGVLIESGQAILDEQGKTEVEFPLDRHLLSGQQGISVVATVVDFDGRAAAASKAYQVDPDFLVGISRHKDRFQMGEEHELKVVVLDKQRKPVSQGTLQAEVLERSWSYVAKRNERGDVYWDDEATWRRAFRSDLPLKEGQAVFRFDCAQPGRYLLSFTFKDSQGQSFASATLVKVDWEYIPEEKRDRPFQPLGLWADRPAYKPGDTANLQITPQGPVSYYLLTLEREGFLSHQVIPGGKGPQNVPLPMKAAYGPNVYVSVLGLSPRGDFPVRPGQYDTQAPGFVWGNLNLPVLKEVEGLEVKINQELANWRARPGELVKVNLMVATPKGQGVEAEVALAVVDEAVLALTGYQTPTLEKLTRFDLPLAVFTGELRTLLVHQTPFYPSKVDPLTGGGGLSADLIDKLRRRFQAVAYFNPQVRTDAQGKAQVSFTLPDNITRYRVFAVALDRTSRFASVERHLVAAKDFYLEPGLPSFFTLGDRFKFQVSATNATGEKGSMQLRSAVEGGLKLEVVDATGQLNPKDSVKLNVTGEATAAGKAKARFAGEFQGRQDEVELVLTVNSGHVRQHAALLGSFSGDKAVKIPLPSYLTGPQAQAKPDEVRAVLTLSGSPFLRFTRPINYLLTYPYGCVEQVSSGVLGLSALRSLIQKNLISGIAPDQVNKFLQSGIGRLMNLQNEQGGFSYWPGQRYSHPVGSLYAMAALSIAKVQGLAVPEVGFKKGMRYLINKVQYGKATPFEKAFACYILSLQQSLSPALYQKAMQEYPALNREGRLFLILAAYQGKFRTPQMLEAYLRPILEGRDGDKDRGDLIEEDFDARFRGPALAVLAGQAILPQDRLTQQAALYLLGGLGERGIWSSTSDTGWALLALGKFYQGATFPEKPGKVTITQPGRSPQEISWAPGGSQSLGLDVKALLQNPQIRLQGEKSSTWLYQVDLTYPRLDLQDKGEDRGFKVTKAIKNTDGTEVIRVGDLVKVTLDIDIQGLARRHVVLDDPLPAGLVAVNTALKTEEPTPEKEQNLLDYVTPGGVIRFFPNHFEIREDRVLAFRDQVYPGTFRFEYYVRAVCEGNFLMPPTQAAAMYNPGIQGFSPQGRLVIKGR